MSSSARPLSRGQLLAVVVAVLAVAAAVIAAAVVVPPAVRAADPERPVRAYLQAIVAGDVAKALELGRVTPGAGDKLLTDAAYRAASDRITAFTLLDASASGRSGEVHAAITQGGASYDATFGVERAGANPFTPWRLAKQRLPQISFTLQAPLGLKLSVAGVPLATVQSTITQHVLPGTYRAAAGGGGAVATQDASAAATFAEPHPAAAVVRVSLSGAGQAAATAAVTGWLTRCAASSELHPDGCPFRAVPEASVSYSDGHWTIQSAPSFVVGQWNAQLGGWPVTTSIPGYVTFTARAAQGGLTGTATTGSNPFSVAGAIEPDASGAVHFVPSPSYSDQGAGGSLT